MTTLYQQAVRDLEARRCPTCRGLGECDDMHEGDISCNTWTCKTCGGAGFKEEKASELVRQEIPFSQANIAIADRVLETDFASSFDKVDGFSESARTIEILFSDRGEGKDKDNTLFMVDGVFLLYGAERCLKTKQVRLPYHRFRILTVSRDKVVSFYEYPPLKQRD